MKADVIVEFEDGSKVVYQGVEDSEVYLLDKADSTFVIYNDGREVRIK